jgi:hypothetical protein
VNSKEQIDTAKTVSSDTLFAPRQIEMEDKQPTEMRSTIKKKKRKYHCAFIAVSIFSQSTVPPNFTANSCFENIPQVLVAQFANCF